MLPVAVVQVVGTLVAAHWGATGTDGPVHPGPPWTTGVASAPVEVTPLGLAMLVAAVVVLPARWRFPVPVLGVAAVTTLGYALVVAPRGPFVAALTMAAVNAWLRGHRRSAAAVVVAAGVVLPWADVVTGRAVVVPWTGIGLAVAWVAVTLSVSELARLRILRAAEARRAEAAERRRRAEDERVRIARELHDSVAHNMSLINLQAGVALHLGDDLPAPTRAALTSIRDASHEALVELRAVLGVLRRVDDAAPGTPDRSPVPGLDRLDDLVVRARAAGLDIDRTVDGPLASLGRIVDRTAFRIVQESITNVMKHAPRHHVDVVVVVGPDIVDLTVQDGARRPASADDGRRAAQTSSSDPVDADAAVDGSAPVDGSTSIDADGPDRARGGLGPSGNGIIGMHERVAAVGGVLEAGPLAGGGWRVHARLPVTDSAAGSGAGAGRSTAPAAVRGPAPADPVPHRTTPTGGPS